MTRVWLFVSLLLFLGCNQNKEQPVAAAPPPKPAPEYHFYPKANVYFDSVNKDYLFLSSDGQTWTTEKQIPAVVHSMMDKSVRIDSPASPVWRDNANHRLVYAAVLYAKPEDTVEKKAPSAPVAKAGPADDKKKERKGGIRRFFSKIFGKKEKEKER